MIFAMEVNQSKTNFSSNIFSLELLVCQNNLWCFRLLLSL